MVGQSNNTDLGNAVNFLLKGRWRLNFYYVIMCAKKAFSLLEGLRKAQDVFYVV